MQRPKLSFGTSSADSRTIALCLLVALAIGGCAGTREMAPVVRAPETVRAHWIAAGEPAPFDGLVLSPEAYSGLREKIARLESELATCRAQAAAGGCTTCSESLQIAAAGGSHRARRGGGAR